MTNKVDNRNDFADLTEMLHQDFKVNLPVKKNKNLREFLESMSRYKKDFEGY
jgi:hypothetical protein